MCFTVLGTQAGTLMWQVMVKCHLKDDDAEEVEVLEMPSGCVRCLAAMICDLDLNDLDDLDGHGL